MRHGADDNAVGEKRGEQHEQRCQRSCANVDAPACAPLATIRRGRGRYADRSQPRNARRFAINSMVVSGGRPPGKRTASPPAKSGTKGTGIGIFTQAAAPRLEITNSPSDLTVPTIGSLRSSRLAPPPPCQPLFGSIAA